MLSALASNGLTVRRTPLWNSSPPFVDLTSCLLFWKPLTVHWLVDHVQILQNDSNCNTTGTVLTWTRLACSEDCSSAKQRSPTWNTVLSFTAELYHRLLLSLWPPQVVFIPSLSSTVTWAFKFLRTPVLSSRDFSDVPVISITGNILLQCKHSTLGYPIGTIYNYTFLQPAN